MALSTAAKLGIGAGVVGVGALLLSTPAKPKVPIPTPIPGQAANPPQPYGVVAIVTILALTSKPDTGVTHSGALRSDGTWTISTQAGSLVAQGTGEAQFLGAWNLYARGGIDGTVVRGGAFVGISVRPPGCAPGFPNRWCWTTSLQPNFVRHDSTTRATALAHAIVRARAGA